MKFASYADGSRDGQLRVVSRDLSLAAPAQGIAPSLRAALEDWDRVFIDWSEERTTLWDHCWNQGCRMYGADV